MNIKLSAHLNMKFAPQELLTELGMDKKGRVQWALSQALIDYAQPKIPASPDRTLEFSAINDYTRVIWNTPYAHYQHEGIVYGPNIPIIDKETGVLLGYFSPPGRPKHPTDKRLTYDTAQNPQAGAHWVQRTIADDGRNIVAKAQATLRGRGE